MSSPLIPLVSSDTNSLASDALGVCLSNPEAAKMRSQKMDPAHKELFDDIYANGIAQSRALSPMDALEIQKEWSKSSASTIVLAAAAGKTISGLQTLFNNGI